MGRRKEPSFFCQDYFCLLLLLNFEDKSRHHVWKEKAAEKRIFSNRKNQKRQLFHNMPYHGHLEINLKVQLVY